MAWWRCVLVVACLVVALTEAQVRRRRPVPKLELPDRTTLNILLLNPLLVDQATDCLDYRKECHLDKQYRPAFNMLRLWGPEILRTGRCPNSLCTREEARDVLWLMSKIRKTYPRNYRKALVSLGVTPTTYG